MSELVRISMSLESDLLEHFDQLIAESGYPTRSEAVKVLMRQRLAESQRTGDHLVAGSITMVYDHHRSGLVQKLMNIQHDFGTLIVSTQHVHLDHDHCLEIVVVRGTASEIHDLVSVLNSTKGVKHNSLVLVPVGENL